MALIAGSVFVAIGAASALGGWMGYKRAQSKASLIAGTVSGAALLTAGGLALAGNAAIGLALGGVTCLALAGRFAPAYFRTRKFMPAGIMAALSASGVLAALLGFAGIE